MSWPETIGHAQKPAYYDEILGLVTLNEQGELEARPATGPARLELALVAYDPATASGSPLHDYGKHDVTYGIERNITFPGDIEGIAAAVDELRVYPC